MPLAPSMHACMHACILPSRAQCSTSQQSTGPAAGLQRREPHRLVPLSPATPGSGLATLSIGSASTLMLGVSAAATCCSTGAEYRAGGASCSAATPRRVPACPAALVASNSPIAGQEEGPAGYCCGSGSTKGHRPLLLEAGPRLSLTRQGLWLSREGTRRAMCDDAPAPQTTSSLRPGWPLCSRLGPGLLWVSWEVAEEGDRSGTPLHAEGGDKANR